MPSTISVRFPDVTIGTQCYHTKSIQYVVQNEWTHVETGYDQELASPPSQLSYVVRTLYQNKGDTSNRIDISASAQEPETTRTLSYFLFEMEEDQPKEFPRIAILDVCKKRIVGVLEWQQPDITKRKSYQGYFYHLGHGDVWIVVHVTIYLDDQDHIQDYDFDFGHALYPSHQTVIGEKVIDECSFTAYSSGLIGESIWHILKTSSRYPWLVSVGYQDCAQHVLRG